MTREDFNTELLQAETVTAKSTFIQKNLVHGTPFVFDGNEGAYFAFRDRIAKRFGIDINSIFIVGSAKIGFSYIKGTAFSLESDVDLVIVDEGLFDEYQKYISNYQYKIDRHKQDLTVGEWEQYKKFLGYFVKGWMRPDLLPASHNNKEIRDQWFQYFNSLSNGKSEVGNYKVTAGLFKSMYYFEKYHMQSVSTLQEKLKVENG